MLNKLPCSLYLYTVNDTTEILPTPQKKRVSLIVLESFIGNLICFDQFMESEYFYINNLFLSFLNSVYF